MKKMDVARISLFVLLISFLVLACNYEKSKSGSASKAEVLNQQQIDSLLHNWKIDSLGCARLRDDQKIGVIIDQLDVLGSDSSELVRYLGVPNVVYYREGTGKTFLYFLACGRKGQTSYYNFYCHFDADTLVQYSSRVH